MAPSPINTTWAEATTGLLNDLEHGTTEARDRAALLIRRMAMAADFGASLARELAAE